MNDLIEKLSNLRSQYNCFDENERDAYNTLSEAIKVLSERLEPCEDAVSRTDMLETYADLYDIFEDNDQIRKELNKVYDKLNALSSVAPKPQIGELVVRECEDTVSREAVIEEIKVCFNMGGCDCGQCNSIIEHINSLPPVTPKRKTGKWITESLADDFAFVYSLKCSECGKYYGWEHNFCPNCGADMR